MQRTSSTRVDRLPVLLLAGLSLLGANSCGGGGGGGGGQGGGVFVDSTVQGLEWVAGNRKGVTNANGRFGGKTGVSVLFLLGDVVLGIAPFERQMTPLSLVPGAMDETDQTVTNIARFLQSLDADGEPANGIVIDKAVREAAVGMTLQFDQMTAAFEADPAVTALLAAAGSPGLVSEGEAQAHLLASLRGSRAGHYTGKYGGDDTGTFSVFIDRSGGLVGCAFSNGDQAVFGVDGAVELNGSGVFGDTTDASTFDGTVGAGRISGNWENDVFITAGSYSGSLRQTPAFVLDPLEIADYLGTYTGTFTLPGDGGTFTATVGANGDLDISDGDPGEIRSTILEIVGGEARFFGVADDGTEIEGTIGVGGAMSGTLFNPHDGVSGTFTATL